MNTGLDKMYTKIYNTCPLICAINAMYMYNCNHFKQFYTQNLCILHIICSKTALTELRQSHANWVHCMPLAYSSYANDVMLC